MLRISGFVVLMAIFTVQAQAKSACYDPQKCDATCQRNAVGKNCKKMCDHQQATLPACK
jgi:hypothetical protein